MNRLLIVACAVLAVLAVTEWRALRAMKTDLATLDARAYRAALVDLHDRRDEVHRALAWLDQYERAADGLNRSGGLCAGGAPDFAAIDTLVFDVYLRERAQGRSELEARQAVVYELRKTTP